jgi:hypothetical protein
MNVEIYFDMTVTVGDTYMMKNLELSRAEGKRLQCTYLIAENLPTYMPGKFFM